MRNARSLLALWVVVILGTCGEGAPSDEASASLEFRQPVEVSAEPTVNVVGGNAAQLQRLDLALDRFGEAGLLLPDREVVFAPSKTECGGSRGRFDSRFVPWRITICSEEIDIIYEHEMAHAWEAATLTAEQRAGFMELRGYSVWDDGCVSPNECGVERAAFIIQQGVSGLPLPPALCAEQLSRLEAFEFLAGFPDPRLADWEGRDDVAIGL